jgi:hypothetical protein
MIEAFAEQAVTASALPDGVECERCHVECGNVVEHDVVVGPHLSDEEEGDRVGEIRRPERDEAMQQVPVVSRSRDLQDEQRDGDSENGMLNATNRLVSRCTDGESAPALPPGARAIPSQPTQRITAETLSAKRVGSTGVAYAWI